MNFSIPFTRKFNYFDQSNIEIEINYKPKVKELQDFIIKYPNKRINLIFNTWDAFDKERDPALIQAFRQKYPECDLVMRLPDYNASIQTLLAEKQLPHYYYIFANRWDILNGLLATSVSDIYITEDLCFSMDIIKQKKGDKRIRVFGNICQFSWPEYDSMRTFFIRPEDVKLYNEYIDVIEFISQNKYQFNTLYDIYNSGARWAGPLKEIIKNFKEDIDSYYILPSFGQLRLNCGKRCSVTDSCSSCIEMEKVAKSLKENQIGVFYKKENLLYNKEDEK